MSDAKFEPGESEAEIARIFTSKFAGNRARADAHEKDERAASRTSKQRTRKPPRTAQVNLRTTVEMSKLADALKAHLGISKAKVFDLAIMELARREGLK